MTVIISLNGQWLTSCGCAVDAQSDNSLVFLDFFFFIRPNGICIAPSLGV